jgi:hypothetical protein
MLPLKRMPDQWKLANAAYKANAKFYCGSELAREGW